MFTIGRESFLRGQRFTFENELPIERNKEPRYPKLNCCAKDIIPLDKKPAWEAFDKCVLCFHAFFCEPIFLVSERETFRYRKCKIHYFLEDDTMEIIEATERNSGIIPGTLVKRHQFKKPGYYAHTDGPVYDFYDLNVGIPLEIYGRVYTTTDCDNYTRKFLTEIGIKVCDAISTPIDPYEHHRRQVDKPQRIKNSTSKKYRDLQFLTYHPGTLRFFCLWDDHKNLFGDKREMILHYFLSDDMIEVIENRPENSGRNDTKVFLKRNRLPKRVERLAEPGELAQKVILNTSGLRENENQYAFDSNPIQEKEIEFYFDEDLEIGKTVNVYGRDLLLYDCDDFTKDFYFKKYGRVLEKINLPEKLRPVLQKEVYPETGFGIPEDSIQNCYRLRPKVLDADLMKFLNHDKYGWDCGQLTFSASILSNDQIKRSRKFVITYYLADDTLAIYEPFQSNSGLCTGKLMMRRKVLKHKTEQNEFELPVYYNFKDMFVGNTLHMLGDDFVLTNANEYTLTYMESHSDQFEHSNFIKILQKMKNWFRDKRDLLSLYFQSLDSNKTGFIVFDSFRSALFEALPEMIPEHEIITLARRYADMVDMSIKLEDIISLAQTELRKKSYNDCDNLTLALKAFDENSLGRFTKAQLFTHLRSCRLPLNKDLLNLLIKNFPATDHEYINYLDLLHALDYVKNPAALSSPLASVNDINWRKMTSSKSLDKINYMTFVNDVSN